MVKVKWESQNSVGKTVTHTRDENSKETNNKKALSGSLCSILWEEGGGVLKCSETNKLYWYEKWSVTFCYILQYTGKQEGRVKSQRSKKKSIYRKGRSRKKNGGKQGKISLQICNLMPKSLKGLPSRIQTAASSEIWANNASKFIFLLKPRQLLSNEEY